MPKTVDGNLWGFQLWVRGPDRFPACAALAAPETGVAASVSGGFESQDCCLARVCML